MIVDSSPEFLLTLNHYGEEGQGREPSWEEWWLNRILTRERGQGRGSRWEEDKLSGITREFKFIGATREGKRHLSKI